MTNKAINQKILRYIKKIKSINYLGGKCLICGEENIFKLTFHHRDTNEKEFELSDYNNIRWSKLKSELDKCDVLCQNCHREFHYDVPLKYDDSRRKDKSIYLEYSGGSCIKCGYNKCPASLGFHHRDPSEKEFWIGGLSERMNSISDLSESIKMEIDKCDLLCQNCHYLEHSDVELFERNKDIIYKKVDDYKEPQSKIDRDEVYKMYDDGIKQKDIANHFNASRGTISDILKPYKISKNIKIVSKVSRELVYELHDSGLRQIDIIRKLKVSRDTVYRILKEKINAPVLAIASMRRIRDENAGPNPVGGSSTNNHQ